LVVEELYHLFMGRKRTVEAARSDVLSGFGQASVDDAALLRCVLVVGGGEFGAINQWLCGGEATHGTE